MALHIFASDGRYLGWHPDESVDAAVLTGVVDAAGIVAPDSIVPTGTPHAAVRLEGGKITVDPDLVSADERTRGDPKVTRALNALLPLVVRLIVKLADGHAALGPADQTEIEMLRDGLLPILPVSSRRELAAALRLVQS